MKSCKRVGLDVTRVCNVRCKTCFYIHKKDFNDGYHVSPEKLAKQIDDAKARGCEHAVLIGWGEPTLYKYLGEFFNKCKEVGFSSSIITNGTIGIKKAQFCYDNGMDHYHVSIHGLDDVADRVLGVEGVSKKQQELMQWLKDNNKFWRSNTTLQQENYKQLPEITQHLINHGCKHIVLLGFLPHYEWNDPVKLRTVAVHPEELRPYLEESIELCEENNVYTTLRYHPMCHIKEEYRKYIVNASYVLYDPWEWDYGQSGADAIKLSKEAENIGNSVAVKGKPCIDCDLKIHCGGWNRVNASGFEDRCNLKAIQGLSKEEKVRGYYFMQNPINSLKGWFE